MEEKKERIGYIHSFESFGAVDGPGVRFVVFMQGCPLRCAFCHNADTWETGIGTEMTAKELHKKIMEYKNFIKNGGVTFSGGEPLLQYEFIADVIELCRKSGLHTAIDTSGGIPLKTAKRAVDLSDMLLLDIKDIDSDDCLKLTGKSNENALEILRYCEEQNKDVWIRHVLVPQYTLNDGKLNRLGAELQKYSCIKRVELIPFHKMGEYKWELLGHEYQLHSINPPTAEEIQNAKEILKKYALPL